MLRKREEKAKASKEERSKENVDPVVKTFSCVVFMVCKNIIQVSGDNSLRVPPVPIPNTEVKPQHADGTWLATARESRSSPDSKFALVAQWQSIRLLTEGL